MAAFFDLTDRIVLVTGAGGGLGRAIAEVAATAGATVIVNDLVAERTHETVAKILAVGGKALPSVDDATRTDDVNRLFDEIESTGKSIDSLVACATPAQRTVPLDEEEWSYHHGLLEAFLKSPMLLTQRALPAMKGRRFGRIVNITSEVFEASEAGSTAYVAAKGAQIGWSRSAARELAEFGITVNTVAPGFIPVERHRDLPQETLDGYLATVPAGRWGTPEEVAFAVLYFLSEEASFVSGQTLIVNGGRTPH